LRDISSKVVLCRVVFLTESLLSLKKSRLLVSLDAALLASASNSSSVNNVNYTDVDSNQKTLDMDAEFAAFQVPR